MIDEARGGVVLHEEEAGWLRVEETGQRVRYDADDDYYYTEDEDYNQTRVEVGGPMEPGAQFSSVLKNELDRIAAEKYGERCHEVATEMQDAFTRAGMHSTVFEVYVEDGADGNHFMVMGSRVRNHYINVLDGLAYDSSTGAVGLARADLLSRLGSENPERTLQTRPA